MVYVPVKVDRRRKTPKPKQRNYRSIEGPPTRAWRSSDTIDEKLVEECARLHCTMEEIASLCGCSVDTLENHFSEIIAKGRMGGKKSLRRLQFSKAEEGNVTMLIWLGRHYLGQNEDLSVSTHRAEVTEIMRQLKNEDRRLSEGGD
jgi:DNA-binding CsgD family transcriptional regulator